MSDDDLRILFLEYDTDGSGCIDFIEFKNSVRGKLNPNRRNVVQLAFKKLDRKGIGEISWDYFKSEFKVEYHPDVERNYKTKIDILTDLYGYSEYNKAKNDYVISYLGKFIF